MTGESAGDLEDIGESWSVYTKKIFGYTEGRADFHGLPSHWFARSAPDSNHLSLDFGPWTPDSGPGLRFPLSRFPLFPHALDKRCSVSVNEPNKRKDSDHAVGSGLSGGRFSPSILSILLA